MHKALKSWEFELIFSEIKQRSSRKLDEKQRPCRKLKTRPCRTSPLINIKNIKGELVRLLLLQDIKNIFQNRVGYTVGRRMGKAHVRNRGRRILREAYRGVADLLPDDLILILSLSDKGLNAKSHEILHELKFLLIKHGVIK